MAGSMNEWARRQMQKLREQFGNKCDICEKKYNRNRHKPNLQFAHIRATGLKGRGRGRKERILDIRKNPDAYRLLCRTCHTEHDALYGDPNQGESL